MTERLYLDYAATTPVAEEVLAAMLPYFNEDFGNAGSRSHAFGWSAAEAVERARQQLAELLACRPSELTFTSGSTESIYLAITGVAERYARRGKHVITTAVEHSAVMATCADLERRGYDVTYLPPDGNGVIEPRALEAALRPDTILCAVLWGNNETGVLQDVRALGRVCRSAQVLLFADATQVVGKVECHPREQGIDLMALSGHKFYGPKGVGALYVSDAAPRVSLTPQVVGGGQESGLRGGTLNVPGIVGMGAAAVLAKAEREHEAARLSTLRNALEASLTDALPSLLINGHNAPRLPHISNVSFRFTEAEALLSALGRRLAVSTGSACSSADLAPSHVLLAMGLDREDAKSAIRISLGRHTTERDIETAADLLIGATRVQRAESPTWELHLDGIVA